MARPRRLRPLLLATGARLAAAYASVSDLAGVIHSYDSDTGAGGPPPPRPFTGGEASMSAGTCPARAWLAFRRIVDIPFETCVART
jgi:hypothetical protein